MNPSPAPRIEIDLDSLLAGSTLKLECLVEAVRRRPSTALRLPFWAARGGSEVRRRLAAAADLDPASLPFLEPRVEQLRQSANDGARVVLKTSFDVSLARRVADYLGIAEVEAAQQAPPRPPARFGWIPRALRPYQWLKNVLVFVPFLLAHETGPPAKWIHASLLFAAFCCCASASYLVNDVLDRRQDRLHPRRRRRPVASGEAPLAWALLLPLPLLALAGLCSAFLPPGARLALVAYVVMAALYSTVIKSLIMADVLLLALLYLLRLLAGSLATGNAVSHWLLAFAVALFLSLALCKRVSELVAWRAVGQEGAVGRSYRDKDAPVLEMMAVAAGFLACLIMVLYMQSPEILRLYRRPEYLWAAVVALLYWLGRLFVYSHRGECPDDPLLFVIQDKTTLAVLAAAGVFAVLAI